MSIVSYVEGNSGAQSMCTRVRRADPGSLALCIAGTNASGDQSERQSMQFGEEAYVQQGCPKQCG